MSYTLVTALLVSYAAAVKITAQAQTAEEVMGFDPAEVVDWWSEVYTPLLAEHAEVVKANAMEKVAGENPELMETCEKGTECRKQVDLETDIKIREAWEQVLVTLKKQVEATTITTQTSVQESWDAKVQCEVDFPCCEYSENYMTNVKIQIVRNRSAHLEVYTKWAAIEDHRMELLGDCPNAGYAECSAQGVCWDGSTRADDDLCSCPEYVATQCPVTVCNVDQDYDDMECSCSYPEGWVDPAAVIPAENPIYNADESANEEVPANDESASDVAPADDESAADVAPADDESANEEVPANDESASDVAPADDESANEEVPAEGESAGDELPTEGESAGDELPTEGESAGDELPTEGESAGDELPSEGESAADQVPQQAADVEQPVENSNEEDRSEDVESQENADEASAPEQPVDDGSDMSALP